MPASVNPVPRYQVKTPADGAPSPRLLRIRRSAGHGAPSARRCTTMSSMSSDIPAAGRDPIALLHGVWAARAAGDLGVLEAALAPDAKWRGIDDGPWNCANRADIMRVMRQNLARGLDGHIEEMIPYGDRIVVAFRPSEAWHG